MSKSSAGLRKDEKLGEGLNRGRWTVVRKVGEGGFAEVYEVHDALLNVKQALKIEKVDKKGNKVGLLKMELRTIKKLQSCPRVCRLVEGGYGTHEGKGYFVMELLGLNLAQLQRSAARSRWDFCTVCCIGTSLLDVLQSIHEAGFIHRDVKPPNFVLFPRDSLQETGEWRAIDFGIARRFIADDGSSIPARSEYNEFRGSTTYASLNAHKKLDLGRRDDLWSWLYIMVEMLDGALPWRPERGEETREADAVDKEAAKEMAQELKRECLEDPGLLTTEVDCPEALQTISRHLSSLEFEAEPDYALLRTCLTDAVRKTDSGAAASALAPEHGDQQGEKQLGKRQREAGYPNLPEKRARAWSTPQHSPYLGNGSSPAPTQLTQPLQSPQSHPGSELAADGSLPEVAGLVKSGWLSPAALGVAEAIGRLDPAEGIGIVSWIVKQLGSGHLDPSGRLVVAQWLQQLASYANQTASRLRRPDQ